MRKITLAGRVGNVRQNVMPAGDVALNFSLAVDAGTKDKPETLWVDCSLFGNRAESLAPYITKGKFLVVDGQAGIRTWAAKDTGEPRGAITCRVDTLTFGPKHETENAAQTPTAPHAPVRMQSPPLGGMGHKDIPYDDEVPF